MKNWTQYGPAIGRRVASELFGNKVGTVVKVRAPEGVDPYPSFDVAFDDATGVERVAYSLITGGSWSILPESIGQKAAQDRHFAYLHEKLRARSEQVQQRAASLPGAPVARQSVAFYRPSDVGGVSGPAAPPAGEAKYAAKALRELFARELDGVRVSVQTRGEVLHVTWLDGPVYVGRLTDRFTAGRAGVEPGPVAAKIVTRREISDELIESALEYVRQAIGEPLRGATAAHFNDGHLRDTYPRSGPHDGLSIGRLVRLALLRWDDYERRFVSEGLTRGMVLENEALFPGKDMLTANSRMRVIRELCRESTSMEEAARILERQGA